MRIAYFLPAFPVTSETFILRQITGMINKGHKVDIYAWDKPKSFKLHPEIEKYRLLDRCFYPKEIAPTNKTFRILKAIFIILKPKSWSHTITLLRSLNYIKYDQQTHALHFFYCVNLLLKNGPYDVVHCQFGTIGLKGLKFKQVGAINCKLITSFRGYDATKYTKKHPHAYDELFRIGNLFLPVSKSLEKILIQLGCDSDKIVVHHSGIDIKQFQYKPRIKLENESIKIISIARLVEKKGIIYGIKAIANLINKGYKLDYAIAGDGPLKDEIEGFINNNGLADNIKLLGWKKHNQILTALDESHILLAPSITTKDGDQEGIPNVLKEAMAMGMPVISTLHSGIPELVQQGVSGYLAPEKDVEDLTDKLMKLCSNSEQWGEMGLAGHNFVRSKFDITSLNNELESLYQ